MQIALIQLQIQPSEKQVNYDNISRLVDLAVTQQPKPDLIVLPELWSTGYALTELETIATDEGSEEAEFLGNLARKYGVWFAGGSVAAKTTRGITNRAQIIDRNGNLQAHYDKVHLVPMLDEHKYLVAGESTCIYEIEGVTIGLAICYDIRFCEFIRKLALQGAQVLIVSAQWPLVRLSHWQTLCKARAIENQCYLIAVNNAAMGDPPFAGHTQGLGPDGSSLCHFEFQEAVKQVSIDIREVEKLRKAVPVFNDRRPELY